MGNQKPKKCWLEQESPSRHLRPPEVPSNKLTQRLASFSSLTSFWCSTAFFLPQPRLSRDLSHLFNNASALTKWPLDPRLPNLLPTIQQYKTGQSGTRQDKSIRIKTERHEQGREAQRRNSTFFRSGQQNVRTGSKTAPRLQMQHGIKKKKIQIC